MDHTEEIPLGLCHCGCGQKTNLITITVVSQGLIKGQPRQYLKGHAPNPRHTHKLSDIDEINRRATCLTCGPNASITQVRGTKTGWRCSVARGTINPGIRKHHLSEIDIPNRRAVCAECGPVEISRMGIKGGKEYWRCVIKRKASQADAYARNKTNPDYLAHLSEYQKKHYRDTRGASQRKSWLKRYGLTPEEYEAMLESQGGGCAICGLKPKEVDDGRRLPVDHVEGTLIVRGILCRDHNTGIGCFDHNPNLLQAAIDYLGRDPGIVGTKHSGDPLQDD